jgi:hypothetical protein
MRGPKYEEFQAICATVCKQYKSIPERVIRMSVSGLRYGARPRRIRRIRSRQPRMSGRGPSLPASSSPASNDGVPEQAQPSLMKKDWPLLRLRREAEGAIFGTARPSVWLGCMAESTTSALIWKTGAEAKDPVDNGLATEYCPRGP